MLTSLKNPKIQQARKLWKRGERDRTDHFLIEGYRELSRACASSYKVELLFTCSSLFLGSHEPRLIENLQKSGAIVFPCSEPVFRKLSYRDRPDGLIGVAKQRHCSLEDLKVQERALFVVAEAVEKPGNLGTILRSADATGVDGVIVCDRGTDIHNPNVVRASVGTLFTTPVVEVESQKARDWLKENNIMTLAATPLSQTDYTQIDLTKPIAIVMGTEQYGLSEAWMEKADIQVRIPMLGQADSLNVAMATTVLLYETLRQRT
ncbi:MAG: RNA methyltransferase [Chlamydiales bacterium]